MVSAAFKRCLNVLAFKDSLCSLLCNIKLSAYNDLHFGVNFVLLCTPIFVKSPTVKKQSSKYYKIFTHIKKNKK